MARLSANGQLLDDNFSNGSPWMVGLKRYLTPNQPSTFDLSILPLRKDAPIYFELADSSAFRSERTDRQTRRHPPCPRVPARDPQHRRSLETRGEAFNLFNHP